MANVAISRGVLANKPADMTNRIYFATDTKTIYMGADSYKYTDAEALAQAGTAITNALADGGSIAAAITNAITNALADGGDIDSAIDSAINTITGSATIASVADGIVTIKAGIVQTNGSVANSTDSDVALQKVATSGAAADVSIADEDNNFTATNVEGALAELAVAAGGGVASKTVYMTEDSSESYAKVYTIYQGASGSSESPVAGEKIGEINIPKDLVVQSGRVVVNPEGQPAGTYIELTIQNQDEKLYINVADLVDAYTAAASATEVQLAISATNEISATIVDGAVSESKIAANAVTTGKIADEAVTTAKIADDAITADKIADNAIETAAIKDGEVTEAKLSQDVQNKLNAASGVTSVTESTENGKITVVTDGVTAQVPVHGLGTAAYTDSTAYDAAGAAAAVVGTSDDTASADTVYGAKAAAAAVLGSSSDGADANTVYGAKAYADSLVLEWEEF